MAMPQMNELVDEVMRQAERTTSLALWLKNDEVSFANLKQC